MAKCAVVGQIIVYAVKNKTCTRKLIMFTYNKVDFISCK